MKRWNCVLLLLSMLALTACGGINTTEDPAPVEDPPQPQQEIVYEKPEYDFENTVRSDRFVRQDTGEEAASYSYSMPMMRIGNEDALSAEDREAALRNVDAFNLRMEELLEEYAAYGNKLLEEQKLLVAEENVPFAVCDEVVGTAVRTGQIVTILADCYFYGGGAHPSSFVVTYTFDLSVGQFIDPTQIGDDPETFRTAAAELLIQHAESLGEEYTAGFWNDYQEIISRWNETAVLFDEQGMTVIFSAYELGPYAMGPVELTLAYEELVDAMGEGGLAHLGVELSLGQDAQ